MREKETTKLYNGITGIDDEILEKAQTVKQRRRSKHSVWIKWGLKVVCLIIIFYVGTRLLPRGQSNNTIELPMLTISENDGGAMGFEGYMAYDVSELVNDNPWYEDEAITTLPVYKNPITYDELFIASGTDINKMRELLLDVVDKLELDINTLTITDDVPDEATRQQITEKLQNGSATVPDGYVDPTYLMIETENLKIKVNQSLTVEISFDPSVSLPSKYKFTYHSSYEDMADVAEYLKTEYKDLIDFNNPQINICGGDYDIDSQQGYRIEFFDANGNNTEQIINYNFNRVAFFCDVEGKLFLIRIYQPDLSVVVGDYPIITYEDASELLSNGNYITTVPYEMPGMEYVKKVELVYRTGELEEYYMPYYRFYVELPEEERADKLKTYGAYYVPAVSSEYISNMPIWNGNFN